MDEIKERLVRLEVEMINVYRKSSELDKKIDNVCIKIDNLKLWIMGVLAGVVGTVVVHFLV